MKITDALDQLLRALTSESGERDTSSSAEGPPRAPSATRPASWGERDDARRAASTTGPAGPSTPGPSTASPGTAGAAPVRAGWATSDDKEAKAPAVSGAEVPGATGIDERFTTTHIESSTMGDRALPEWVRRSRDSAAGAIAAQGAAPGRDTPLGGSSPAPTAESDPIDVLELPVDEGEPPPLPPVASFEPVVSGEPPFATLETVLPVPELPVTGSPVPESEALPGAWTEPAPVSGDVAWAPSGYERFVDAPVDAPEPAEVLDAAPPAADLDAPVEEFAGPPPVFGGVAWAPPEPAEVLDADCPRPISTRRWRSLRGRRLCSEGRLGAAGAG